MKTAPFQPLPRPPHLRVVAVAGTLALVAHAFGCWTPPVHVYPAVSVADPAAAATRYRDQACSITVETNDGRSDPDKCGPFPCVSGHCQVATCEPGSSTCHPGVCTGGYCLSAAPVGARACEATAPKDEGETLFRGGCRCVPQSAAAPRDRAVCGSLPCGLHGCYVQPCHRDNDCLYGICSSHASSPHGYCVTDDPY